MVRKIKFGDTEETIQYFAECPDDAGIELKTIVDNALEQLNQLLDETYRSCKAHSPGITRPALFVYIRENQIKDINAFTDGMDIYISVAAMIGMHSYISERLDTLQYFAEEPIPEGLEAPLKIRIYADILKLIVAHELIHIWHGHRLWKRSIMASISGCDDPVLSERVLVDNSISDEADDNLIDHLSNFTSSNVKLILQSRAGRNYIQQILEMDADCCAVQIVFMHLQREMREVVKKHLAGNHAQKKSECISVAKYHSYLIGLLAGAIGLMCGFFDSKRIGKPFDRLAVLLAGDHPIPAIRFFKMHTMLLTVVHHIFPDRATADALLSKIGKFSVEIFMYDGTSMDIKNCYWAPAQTKDAQEFIAFLEKGWNDIRDSLQRYSLLDLPRKFTEADLEISEELIIYDRFGNLL